MQHKPASAFIPGANAHRSWVTMLVLGMLAGCNELLDIQPGIRRPNSQSECVTIDDCVQNAGECIKALSCENGQCKFELLPDGQPTAIQTSGDCAVRACDGKGKAVLEPNPTDIEDDDNPCTYDHCTGTVRRHDPLNEVACYPGPAASRHVGACKDGILHCFNGQPMGECEGAIIPMEETCTTAVDDDCDGAANEGGIDCVCTPGTTIPCYSGPANTIDAGQCHAGSQICLGDGTGYGPCMGEQLPAAETCDAAIIDEDCDGMSNEEGDNCQCGDGVVQTELGEACDDGNDDPTDSCVNCRLPSCGDGHVQAGTNEECDDGNANPTDECTTSCLLPRCGDGLVQPTNAEGCDDGNTNDGDDCPGNCQPHAAALAAGALHTCAVFDDGRVKCWGANDLGQLGLGDTQRRGNNPARIGYGMPIVNLGGTVVSLAAGSMHTCALFDSGQVKCWGANQFGQLGLGDTQTRGDQMGEMGAALPIVELGESATALSLGSAHSCALLASGSVKCWGYGYFGQLGKESRDNFGALATDDIAAAPAIDLGTGRTATTISAGQYHTCALLDDGSLKCWGYNEYGQLGQGDTAHRGDDVGEMGNALAAIAWGNGVKALRVASGAGHVCVTLEGNTMKCWGANYFGQLGLGDNENRGDDPGEIALLPAIDFGNSPPIMTVSLGATHGCAQLQDSSLRCFGRGSHGQLGQGNGNWIGDTPGEVAALLPIDLGMNQVPIGFTSGGDHACALVANGHVKCWGRNDNGQLGVGDVEARGDEKDEMGSFLPPVKLW